MSSMYPSFGGAPARPCARCGAPLTINETQCSRCGTYNPLPQQGQQFGSFQQGAQGGGPGPSGPLWGGQPPQGSQYQQPGNGAWPGNQDASASAWGSRGQAGGGGWQQNNSNPFGGQEQPQMPQQNMFGGQEQPQMPQQNMFGSGFAGQNQPPFSNFQQNPNPSPFNNNSFGGSNFQQSAERPSMNSFFQATQQNGYGGASPMTPNRPAWMKKPGDDDDVDNGGKGKKRPGANVILVIIILLVALVGGGAYGGYYFYKHRTTSTTSTPTTSVQAIVTPSIAPLFSDSFKNNSNKWDTTTATGGKITLAGDGKLVLESDTGSLIVPALVPGGKTFGDLRVDVDALLTSSDVNNGYGIYVRASTQNGTLGLYYRFEVYGDGNFFIYKGFQDTAGKLQYKSLKQSLQPSDAINHAGKINHLTVIAKGQTLTFSVNGTTLSTFTDATYKSGRVALFDSMVKTATSNSQTAFEHLAIFPAQ